VTDSNRVVLVFAALVKVVGLDFVTHCKRGRQKNFVGIGGVVVNAPRIKELKRLFCGGCEMILQDGTKLRLSRRYRDKLQQLGIG